MFGTLDDFKLLTQEARKRGMRVLLDGVFNHVGDDSVYFDRYGKYEWVGAYEYWSRVYDHVNIGMLRVEDAKVKAEQELLAAGQKFSPYKWQNWFDFRNRKVSGRYDYQGWSGYDSLPAFTEPSPEGVETPVVDHASELNNRPWADYMLYDDNSVAKRWLTLGASGWRLDVAPEVDSAFWREFRKELKQMELLSGDAPVILGETWQDAAHFFLGDQFDSVMNYGFRHAVVNEFLLNGNAASTDDVLQSMRQNYPEEAFYALMNLIDSHDTARAVYLLGGGQDEQVLAEAGKNFDENLGLQRLKLAALFQMGYPGIPAIYYGDEAGLTGARDPDCRRPYPWGQENQELLAYYRALTDIRANHTALFAHGELFTLHAEGDVYVYGRKFEDRYALVALNRGDKVQALAIPTGTHLADALILNDLLDPDYAPIMSEGELFINLPPLSGRLLLSK
jgi:glycosidase